MSGLPAQDISSIWLTIDPVKRRPTEYCYTRRNGNSHEYVGKFLRNKTDEQGNVVSHVFSLGEAPYNGRIGSFRIVACRGHNRLPNAMGHAPDPALLAKMNRINYIYKYGTSPSKPIVVPVPSFQRRLGSRRLIPDAKEYAAEINGEIHQAALGGHAGGRRRTRRGTRNLRRKTAKKSHRKRKNYSRRN